MTLRVAAWSGPRNLSTAMMRAWENRADCAVVDEPLYAHYLKRTGLEHPMGAEVMASQPQDWRAVVRALTGPAPGGAAIWYQKHMTHHMLPVVGRSWLKDVANIFLIRRPDEVAVSYHRARRRPTLEDLGLPQQVALFRYVTEELGQPAIVLDSRDLLVDPEGMLGALCAALGVPFDPAMLSWPPGRRDSDGVWAPHWYASVEASTGFAPYQPREVVVPEALGAVVAAGEQLYGVLYAQRLGR